MSLNNLKRLLFGFALLSSVATVSQAANWPQFRGVDSRGVAEGSNLPDEWSASKNIAWKTDVDGRGWSSPIVWGDRVYLTTVVHSGEVEKPKKGLYFGGNRPKPPTTEHVWKVVCLDLNSGKPVWEKVVHKGLPSHGLHIKNSYASETPVTDGDRVYAYFGNVGLFCFDMDGNRVWEKKWPAVDTRYGWGTAASPVLYEDRIYIVNDNDDASWLVALDKMSGKQVWKIDRDEKSNWATPFVWQNKLRTELITPGTNRVRSYDLDGKLLYEFGGMSSITIAMPFASDELLYVTSGYVLDKKKPIFAIRPGASGDISLGDDETENDYIAWCQKQAGPYNPSTLLYDGLLYVLLDRGLFACYDAQTGETVYGKKRIPKGKAFTSSPWAANGKIFCVNEDGVTFVIQAGRKFKILHTNSLTDDDMCMATPAIAGDKLLIRTERRVYCVAAGGN